MEQNYIKRCVEYHQQNFWQACEEAKHWGYISKHTLHGSIKRTPLKHTIWGFIRDCAVEKGGLETLEKFGAIKNAIYVIEQVGGNPEVTFKSFEAEKESQKEKELQKDRINYPKPNHPSKIMYVGSSTTDLMARIKKHTAKVKRGKEGKLIGNSYALRLGEWYEGDYKITIMQYDDETSPAVIQIIEDAISSHLKPAFGKQGGNNR